MKKISEDVLGFYKTSDGRETLRHAYLMFLEVQGIGHEKAAQPLVHSRNPVRKDTPADSAKVDRAVNALKMALKRWAEGKPELFRDRRRNEKCLAALEREMMKVPEVKAILENQAASAKKLAIASAFASFFHGSSTQKSVQTNLDDMPSGLFEIIHMSQQGDEKSSETPWTSVSSDGWWAHFQQDDQIPCTIINIFKLSGDSSGYVIGHEPHVPELGENSELVGFRFRQSGFGFLLHSGEIHCVLADVGPPGLRTYAVLSPYPRQFLHVTERLKNRSEDFVFEFGTPDHFSRKHRFPGRYFSGGPCLFRRADRMVERIISVKVEKMKWSMVL